MDIRIGTAALLVALLGVVGFLMVVPYLQFVLGAALLAFVLYPLHERLEPRVGTRISAGLVTTFAFVVAIVPMAIILFAVLTAALTALESYSSDDLLGTLDGIRSVLRDDLGIDPATIDAIERHLGQEIDSFAQSAGNFFVSELIGIFNTTVYLGIGFLLLVFLLYYFLADGDRLVRWITTVLPMDEAVRDELFEEMARVTWAVVQSHLLIAVVEGILGGIGLWLVGVPNAGLLTVVMVVVSVLPIVGIWLVWAPAVVYLGLTGDALSAGLLLVYGVTVLSVVDNYLRAIVVDRGSGLHPAAVLVGVVGGISLLGVLGLFLGPVLLAVFKASATVFSREYDGEPA